MTKKIKKNILSEPVQAYAAVPEEKRIHFFSSIEDENKANHKYMASISPEEHLRNATDFIKRIFSKELKENPGLGNRISFH